MNPLIIFLIAVAVIVTAVIVIKNQSKPSPWPGKNRNGIPTADEWEGFLGSFEKREFLSYSELTDYLFENSGKINYYEQNPDFKSQFEAEVQKKKDKLAKKK